MAINWRKGEPKSDSNPIPVKLVDAIDGEPVDLEALFSSITVDVGDIDLGSITIKDGASGNLAAIDASGRLSVDGSSVTQPISAASLPLPLGAATSANQTTIVSALGDIVTNTTGLATEAGQVAQQAALEDIVTATEAIQAAVEGTITITGTVAVTGPLTDAQLRASAVPISGAISFTVPQHVIIDSASLGTVTVTGPLTDTQLRATPVPVSGTVAVTGPLTDTQLRATPVPVTGIAASNGSVALTTGGVAQDLFASATPSNGYLIVNPDANEILWLNEGADAVANGTGSIPIFPLGGYETPPLYKPFGRVSVIAATTGHKITARKW